MIDNIVGAGYVKDVYYLTVYGIPLGDDNYHVVVEVAFVEDALLSISNEESLQHWLFMSLDPLLLSQNSLSYLMI